MSGLVLSACFIPILKVRKTESWWSEVSWPAKYLSAPMSANWGRKRIRAEVYWFIKHLVLNCCPGLPSKWVPSHLWTSIDEMGPDWTRLFVGGDHYSKSSTGANGFGMNQLPCLYTEVSERKGIHFCLSPSQSHLGVSRAFPPSCLRWSSAAQGGRSSYFSLQYSGGIGGLAVYSHSTQPIKRQSRGEKGRALSFHRLLHYGHSAIKNPPTGSHLSSLNVLSKVPPPAVISPLRAHPLANQHHCWRFGLDPRSEPQNPMGPRQLRRVWPPGGMRWNEDQCPQIPPTLCQSAIKFVPYLAE